MRGLGYAAALVVIGVVGVSACEEPRPRSTNPADWSLTKLFTTPEGCTVYRFYDGPAHYLTTCPGSVTGLVPAGKAHRADEIPTVQVEAPEPPRPKPEPMRLTCVQRIGGTYACEVVP